jgi:hypothetical protein
LRRRRRPPVALQKLPCGAFRDQFETSVVVVVVVVVVVDVVDVEVAKVEVVPS